MPDTIVGLVLLVVILLPGLAYVLAYERQAGGFGVTLADRTLRLFLISIAFHLVFGWLEYLVYRQFIMGKPLLSGQVLVLWLSALIIVVLPAIAGSVVGSLYATRRNRDGLKFVRKALPHHREQKLLRLLLGPSPAPRAWDYYFSERPMAFVRIRTVDGTLIGGLFARNSYAAGYPESPDLLIEQAWKLDDDGNFAEAYDYSLYIAAAQVAWLELLPPAEEGE